MTFGLSKPRCYFRSYGRSGGMKRRALVIDDNLPSRTFLIKALNKSGFEVAGEEAKGAKALELAIKTAPDIVLMAVGLRDMDGISAAKKIMEENPAPIVL